MGSWNRIASGGIALGECTCVLKIVCAYHLLFSIVTLQMGMSMGVVRICSYWQYFQKACTVINVDLNSVSFVRTRSGHYSADRVLVSG
jgi:hypothetical protein